MDKLIETKANRFKFLKTLYEVTQGDEYKFVSMWDIGEELGFSRNDVELISQYLAGEDLIKFMTLGGGISITHWGVVQVEEALEKPDKPTDYFPPTNIINIQNMIGSQIQQGNSESVQTVNNNLTDIKLITDFIEDIQSKLENLGLSNDDKSELVSEITTIKAQMSSVRPKFSIIKESAKTIRNILEGIAGSIIATELLSKLSSINF